MTAVILIFVLVYVVSAVIVYRWVQRAYSYNDDYKKCGKHAILDPDSYCMYVTFTPIINIMFAITALFISSYLYKKPKKDYRTFYQKLFNIKKKPTTK
jgi:hypothetical protein